MLNIEEQIFKQINKAQQILVTAPLDWNGDAIASSLALFLFLKKLNKKVDLVIDKSLSENSEQISAEKLFSFLPGFDKIQDSLDNLRKFIVSLNIKDTKINQIKYTLEKDKLNFIVSPQEGFFTSDDISSGASGFKYDLIITLDAMDLESLGKTYDNHVEFFYKTPVINIDHHASNEEFGQVNLVNLNAVATAELLFSLLKSHSLDLIDEDIATCLLAGIIHKSKSFKTPNLTPKTLLATSQLINLGARREEVINHLYRSRSLQSLKLWGKVLNNLKAEQENQLIHSSLTINDFIDTKSSSKYLLSVIDELISSIPSAKIITIFYPEQDNPEVTNFLLYSIKNINSLEMAKEFKPQGTQKIIKATVSKPLKEASQEVVTKIKNRLAQMSL